MCKESTIADIHEKIKSCCSGTLYKKVFRMKYIIRELVFLVGERYDNYYVFKHEDIVRNMCCSENYKKNRAMKLYKKNAPDVIRLIL